MSLIACANACKISKYSLEALHGQENSLTLCAQAMQGIPGIDKILYIIAPESNAEFADPVRELAGSMNIGKEPVGVIHASGSASTLDVLKALRSNTTQEDTIVFFAADSALLGASLAGQLVEAHRKYRAEYTFADGYPLGYSPEIVEARVLSHMIMLAEGMSAAGAHDDLLFPVIEKDINSFEVETLLAVEDVRSLRLDLRPANKLAFKILRKVMAAHRENAVPDDPAEFASFIAANQHLYRSIPAWFNVQITAQCPQVCVYCPWGQRGESILSDKRRMPLDDIRTLIDKIADWAPGASLSLSLWGEPALHPDIYRILALARDETRLHFYIETSGIGWNIAELERVFPQGSRVPHFVVGIDSIEEQLYSSLRGPGLQEAMNFTRALHRIAPEKVWIQALRMEENEESLGPMYRKLTSEGFQVLIQKYDHFSNRLPRRSVTEISPLARPVCWHLKRDLNILIDGTALICREAVEGEPSAGNVFSDGLEKVWANLEPWFLDHTKGKYAPLCAACDEYYTFNA